jgi:hypothetical protein
MSCITTLTACSQGSGVLQVMVMAGLLQADSKLWLQLTGPPQRLALLLLPGITRLMLPLHQTLQLHSRVAASIRHLTAELACHCATLPSCACPSCP